MNMTTEKRTESTVTTGESFIKQAWGTLVAHYKKEQPEATPLSTQDLLDAFQLATDSYLPAHQLNAAEPYRLDSRIQAKAAILSALNNHILKSNESKRHSLMRQTIDPMKILQDKIKDPRVNKETALLLESFITGSAEPSTAKEPMPATS
jgi:hypothetical protein